MPGHQPVYCPEALALLKSPAGFNLSPFTLSVLHKCAGIPKGRVTTYGHLAAALGRPGAAQAVGNALHANPFAPTVPCHRVLPASGRIGGFEGKREGCGGASEGKKRALLEAEGIVFHNGKLVAAAEKMFLWEGAREPAAAAPAPSRKRQRE